MDEQQALEQQRLLEEDRQRRLQAIEGATRQAREQETGQIRTEERARALSEFGGQVPDQPFIEDQEARLQQQSRTFSDRLRDRTRTFEALNLEAGERFAGAFDEEIPRRPSDIFRGFQTFQTAGREFVEPLEKRQFETEQLLAQVQASKRMEALELIKLGLEGQQGGLGLGLGIEGGEMTPAGIKTALGKSMEDRLDKNALNKYLDRLAQLRNIQRLLASTNPSSNSLANILDSTTGLLTGYFGQSIGSTTQKEVRQAITQYRTFIRFKYFGSVLTKNEMKEANKFLVGVGVQESVNAIRLDNDIKQVEGELRNFLGTRGYTPEDTEVALASTQYGYETDIKLSISPEGVTTPVMVSGAQVGKEGTRLDPYQQEAESDLGDF